MNTEEIIRLAEKYCHINESAKLCAMDALSLLSKGKPALAEKRALASLKHSVGIFHQHYKNAK